VAGARRSEKGAAAIATEGNEVEITASVKALQTVAHEKVWDNAKSKRAAPTALGIVFRFLPSASALG